MAGEGHLWQKSYGDCSKTRLQEILLDLMLTLPSYTTPSSISFVIRAAPQRQILLYEIQFEFSDGLRDFCEFFEKDHGSHIEREKSSTPPSFFR
jgi:hypothetical protein